MSAFEMIAVEQQGAVAILTLNRPDRLNACPPQMAEEMLDAIADLGDSRALLIKGEGRAFCSGADLASNAQSRLSGGDRAKASLGRSYNPLIQALVGLPIPVIAQVQGPAAGIGCSIALAADFVVSGKSGYFLQAFVNIGLVPDGGSSWMLPRLVGLAQATRMMMLGDRISGEEAERIGLIYRCVEDDALEAEARALAERLANGPTLAIAQMKRVLRQGLQADLATTLAAEAEAQAVAGNTADAAEGAMAFLQKRAPSFSGT